MRKHPFSLRQLQYAVVVAETLSFRGAAERCFVSQPSLSAQVAELENAIGFPLFERSKRKVMVLPTAAPFLERAARLLLDADALRQVTPSDDPLRGVLRLGVIPTIAPYLLPACSRHIREAHPALTIHWHEDKTESLCAKLAQGELDGAVLALEAELGDVDHAVIMEDEFVVAAPPSHPLLAHDIAQDEDLMSEPTLLLDEGHCLRDQALAYCKFANVKEGAYRATSLTTLVQLVAQGAGVTLLPTLAIPLEATRAGIETRPIMSRPRRTLVTIWRRTSPLGPALTSLSETIRDAQR